MSMTRRQQNFLYRSSLVISHLHKASQDLNSARDAPGVNNSPPYMLQALAHGATCLNGIFEFDNSAAMSLLNLLDSLDLFPGRGCEQMRGTRGQA